jgi:hypothetical protein
MAGDRGRRARLGACALGPGRPFDLLLASQAPRRCPSHMSS